MADVIEDMVVEMHEGDGAEPVVEYDEGEPATEHEPYEGGPVRGLVDAAMRDVSLARGYLIERRRLRMRHEPRFAGGTLAPADFVTDDGEVCGHDLDGDIVEAYIRAMKGFASDPVNFLVDGFELRGAVDEDGTRPLYIRAGERFEMEATVGYGTCGLDPIDGGYVEVTDDFHRFLAARDSWDFAGGAFEDEMAALRAEEVLAVEVPVTEGFVEMQVLVNEDLYDEMRLVSERYGVPIGALVSEGWLAVSGNWPL